MGKQNEYMRGFREGMLKAWKIYKEGGEAALKKEIIFRGQTRMNLKLSSAEIEECAEEMKAYMMSTIGTMACMALRNEFGFGHDRMTRFLDRYDLDTQCLMHEKDITCWGDYLEALKDECGIDVQQRWNKNWEPDVWLERLKLGEV